MHYLVGIEPEIPTPTALPLCHYCLQQIPVDSKYSILNQILTLTGRQQEGEKTKFSAEGYDPC